MLYTRTGDSGTSELFGTKSRLPKYSQVFEALGTVDELNSLLGLCRAKAHDWQGEMAIGSRILSAQQGLFIIQAELAGAGKSVTKAQVVELEVIIEELEELIVPPIGFVIPGETELSAFCDYARAVARRAERLVCAVAVRRNVSPASLAYLNRLSSLLYALARYTAAAAKTKELSPTY